MSNPPLSIVIPCYNEADGIDALYERVSAVARDATDGRYEIVFVNDGSRDATWEKLVAKAQADANVVAVNLSRNMGHQLALTAGLAYSRGERVLVLDADLQDPPELLPKMMQLMDDGADVVYGQRVERKGETIFKRASASVFYKMLSWLTDTPIPRDTGDFRLMSRRVVDALNRMPESQRFVRGMVSWVGFRQVPIPYERDARTTGASNYPLRKMVRLALDAITGFSTRPLRLASILGLIFAGLGLIGIVISVGGWLAGSTVPGWTSAMVVALALGGIQLVVLGIIGEYLGRLYLETKRRPLYIVEEVFCNGRPVAAEPQGSPNHG